MSLRRFISGLAVLIITLSAPLAQAQSLKTRKVQYGEEQTLEAEVAYTNQVCQSDIQASVDWDSFPLEALEQGERPSGSCDIVLGALESLCGDQTRQDQIKKRIGRVVCTKGDQRTVSLKEGTLFFQYQGSAVDDFRYIRDYLAARISESDEE